MKPLRKRHLQIWMALAMLLPVGIVFAWLVIPNPSPVKLLQSQSTELLPVIKQSSDQKDYCINVRSNKDNTQWQLEWKNKNPLTAPSAVIYKTSLNPSEGGTSRPFIPNNSQLIGRIEARGDYTFLLPHDSSGYKEIQLILFDFIHQQIIDTINFQP